MTIPVAPQRYICIRPHWRGHLSASPREPEPAVVVPEEETTTGNYLKEDK